MRKLIRTDGTEQAFDKPLSNPEIRRLIGTESLDFVSLIHLGEPLHVMAVDDFGYEAETINHPGGRVELRPVRALKPVNPMATKLYHANCIPGTTHQIVGDVVIVPDGDFA